MSCFDRGNYFNAECVETHTKPIRFINESSTYQTPNRSRGPGAPSTDGPLESPGPRWAGPSSWTLPALPDPICRRDGYRLHHGSFVAVFSASFGATTYRSTGCCIRGLRGRSSRRNSRSRLGWGTNSSHRRVLRRRMGIAPSATGAFALVPRRRGTRWRRPTTGNNASRYSVGSGRNQYCIRRVVRRLAGSRLHAGVRYRRASGSATRTRTSVITIARRGEPLGGRCCCILLLSV